MNTFNQEAALGGSPVPVVFRDGRDDVALVQELSISKLNLYVQLFEDPSKCIELFCDKPAGWADTLKPASALAVLSKGQDLNSSFLAETAALKTALREKAIPNYRELMENAMATALQSGSPASPLRQG